VEASVASAPQPHAGRCVMRDIEIWPRKIAKPYRRAMIFAVSYQVPLGILCGLMLDGGLSFQIFGMAMAGFWPSVALIIRRSPKQASKLDLLWIRAGGLLVMIVVATVAPVVWKLRGVWYE
jgi:hypothetical protein